MSGGIPVAPTPTPSRVVFIDGSGHTDFPHSVGGKGNTDHYTAVACQWTPDGYRQYCEGTNLLLAKHFPGLDAEATEIHLSWMIGKFKKGCWKNYRGRQINRFLSDFQTLLLEPATKPLVFGQVINKLRHWERAKRNHYDAEPPLRNVFRFLGGRIVRNANDLRHKVDVYVDQDSDRVNQALTEAFHRFRTTGDGFPTGAGMNIQWTPVSSLQFVDSRIWRGIQAADFVAYYLQRAVEHKDATRLRSMDQIWRRFGRRREPWTGFTTDEVDTLIHGTVPAAVTPVILPKP